MLNFLEKFKIGLPNHKVLLEDTNEVGAGGKLPKEKQVDTAYIARRQQRIREMLLKDKATEVTVQPKLPADVQRLDELARSDKNSLEFNLRKQFQIGDDELNKYVFGNIPLKYVDFTSPSNYQRFRNKKPEGKQQITKHQFEKLKIMFDVAYTPDDFDALKTYSLNSEQLLTLLKSENFGSNASKEKVIDVLKALQKSREIRIFKERAEVMSSVRALALDHRLLATLDKLSYVSSFVHCVSRMKIDDEQVWSSLASFIVSRHEEFNGRELSNIVFALSKIQKLKPVILNFDDVFRTLEISFIKKFDNELVDGQSLANTVLAYSKTANGSKTFFRALEGIIL